MVKLRTGKAEIIDNGLANSSRERVCCRVPIFPLGDVKNCLFPIDVVQLQCSYFLGTQAIGGEQEQNCLVPLPDSITTIDELEHTFDFVLGY